MIRRFVAFCLTLAAMGTIVAQGVMPARPLMVAYDDEKAVAREAYRESPYYMELSGAWRQKNTDSSILYIKQLDVEHTWKDYRVYLNVRAGHACRVYLGNKVVGYGDDSRQWNEFLLNPFLKYGKQNTLTIETLKHPVGALLEDSSIATGLNGEPFILFKTDPGISDLTLTADYDAAYDAGTLTVDASLFNSSRKGRYYVEVEVLDPKGKQLDRMGRWVIYDKSADERTEISRTWSGIMPWSAESPSLYTVLVRLRNEKMEEVELVGANIGFRRVEVKDKALLVNGKPITLRGVTYGVEHTEGAASRQQMERTIQAMKQNGINAVRTSRYSPMEPYFYSLCDRYGLYVVADANLKPASSGKRVVATEKDMIPLFEQRVEHLYGRYKNHPSIIMWSLGNTLDNGVCMTAAYKRLKSLDKSRPVMFSGAQMGENTDIIAPTFPKESELRQTLEKADRPVVMARIVDAAHFPQIGGLWQLVDDRVQLQGGFLDAWPLSADMLYDIRNLYAPFTVTLIRVGGGEGEFRVANNCDFASFARYKLEYTIYTNLRPNIISGELPLAVKAGESEKVGMRIPQLDLQQGEEPYIRFDIAQRAEGRTPEMPVSRTVFPLDMRRPVPERFVPSGDTIQYYTDSTNTLHVLFAGLHATYDHSFNVFPAGAVNKYCLATPYLAFEGHLNWEPAVLAYNHRAIDANTLCIDAMVRYTAKDGRTMCDVRETYVIYGNGDITVDYKYSTPDGNSGKLTPIIYALNWQQNQTIHWYGQKHETAIATRPVEKGTWHPVKVNSLVAEEFGYQEERHEVRWCMMTYEQGPTMMARLAEPSFTMRQNPAGLTLLPKCNGQTVRLILSPWRQSVDSLAQVFEASAMQYPVVSSGIPEPPVIKADAVRFAQPLTVSIKAVTDGDIRYTIDGSDPTPSSPLYTKPFVINATTVVKARLFAKDMPPSFTASRKFNYDYIYKTTFSRKPNTPYNVGTDTILFDGERASLSNLTSGWLGFSGGDITTTIDLAKPIDVEAVVLRYAHNPATWAFAPRVVMITMTSDGTNYGDAITDTIGFNPADQGQTEARVVELRVPVDGHDVSHIKVVANTIGTIPTWHRGKGLNPWLLMDEIEVIEKMKD